MSLSFAVLAVANNTNKIAHVNTAHTCIRSANHVIVFVGCFKCLVFAGLPFVLNRLTRSGTFSCHATPPKWYVMRESIRILMITFGTIKLATNGKLRRRKQYWVITLFQCIGTAGFANLNSVAVGKWSANQLFWSLFRFLIETFHSIHLASRALYVRDSCTECDFSSF